MIGKKFERLTILGIRTKDAAGNCRKMFLCRCDCGKVFITRADKVLKGGSKSCGCLKNEKLGALNRTHGHSRTPLHNLWMLMIGRCTNPNNPAFKHYGGRGIEVCGRWTDGEHGKPGFICFLEDMGNRPDATYSLERIDVNGNYTPENCKWIPKSMQLRNTRRNVLVTYAGKTRSIVEWAETMHIPYKTLQTRLKRGWTPERALST